MQAEQRHLLFVCNVLLAGRGLKQDPFSPRSMQDRQLDSQRKAQQQMDKMGEFDSLTVLGAILALGIGNGIAKAWAQKRANPRQQQLQRLALKKRLHPVSVTGCVIWLSVRKPGAYFALKPATPYSVNQRQRQPGCAAL
ncbi:hypothetical protein [Erwinia pyrifoliae]|uniref:Uncharacterized protein n=1 Tax=Erwinia pyrifoliae TaxID=79967 RepID=A0ABY5XCW1_ERWPY|nr:hypothetical protein [Erwinia pyrifoliae]UWS35037.1 hypothetical protein NYP84_07810 [Erwinia pyrifoliae]